MSPSDLIQHAWDFSEKESTKQRKRHVSVIVRNREPLVTATNQFEVPSRYAYRGYRSLHSEVHAFMKCNVKDNLTLYNFRFNNQKQLRMAKPCKICMPWCEAVFETIIYSDKNGQLVQMKGLYS
jgi:hypothetical protein